MKREIKELGKKLREHHLAIDTKVEKIEKYQKYVNTELEHCHANAYYNNELTYNKDDMVLVLYADLNFIANLTSNIKVPKETTDVANHSLKFGIIVPQNIELKTINHQSLFGTGNINISGGGSTIYKHNLHKHHYKVQKHYYRN